MYMSGLEISKTIFPFSKGHQIAIENNCFNHAYISIAYGDLCMVETVRRCSRGGGGVYGPPPQKKKKNGRIFHWQTSATLERTFSTLRRLKNYLICTMMQERLTN